MTNVRIATFNCENLFVRYKFNENPPDVLEDGWLPDKTKFDINDPKAKKLTADAIKETGADIIALQEVESLITLRLFIKEYLKETGYRYFVLIDGNDERLIDVAVISKYPIQKIDTNISDWSDELNNYVYSRDCLECDVLLPEDKKIRLFINHLKSMADFDDPCNGRRNTRPRRIIQVKRTKEIILDEFPQGEGNFAILGDLNDYPSTDSQGETSLGELLNWDKVENVIDRLPDEERWTHYYKGNPQCNFPKTYKQLDYILLSKTIANNNPSSKPVIVRKGLPLTADRYTGPRFDGVGHNNPKASDHCPMVIEVNI
jgi:endonuclease/exonuclease/phosphatase family metal-dependent hydrolase